MPTSTSVSFVLSGGKPTITIHEPAFGTVLRRITAAQRLRATCVTTAPPCTFTGLETSGPELDVPLSNASSGDASGARSLTLRVQDSLGQTAEATTFYIDPSERLHEVLSAPEGEVVAFDGTRALVRSPDMRKVSLWTATGLSAVVYEGDDEIRVADLHVRGALVSTEELQAEPAKVWSFVDGTLTRMQSAERARANGKWLAYATKLEGSARLVVRDLITGQDVWTSRANSFNQIRNISLAANGDVAWYEGATAAWRHGEQTITLAGSYAGGDLQTDGVNASYRSSGSSVWWMYLHNGTEQLELCRANTINSCPIPALTGGWAAYQTLVPRALPASPFVPLRRSPTGGVEELTGVPEVAPLVINAMGEAVIRAGGRLYLARTPSTAEEITAWTGGKFVYHSGAWYRLLGRSVFRVRVPGDQVPDDAGRPIMGDAGTPSPTDAAAPAGSDAAPLAPVASPERGMNESDEGTNVNAGTGTVPDPGGNPGSPNDPGAFATDRGVRDAGAPMIAGGMQATNSGSVGTLIDVAADASTPPSTIGAADDGCSLSTSSAGGLDSTALLLGVMMLRFAARRRKLAAVDSQ